VGGGGGWEPKKGQGGAKGPLKDGLAGNGTNYGPPGKADVFPAIVLHHNKPNLDKHTEKANLREVERELVAAELWALTTTRWGREGRDQEFPAKITSPGRRPYFAWKMGERNCSTEKNARRYGLKGLGVGQVVKGPGEGQTKHSKK